jgi:hypothetical protein
MFSKIPWRTKPGYRKTTRQVEAPIGWPAYQLADLATKLAAEFPALRLSIVGEAILEASKIAPASDNDALLSVARLQLQEKTGR